VQGISKGSSADGTLKKTKGNFSCASCSNRFTNLVTLSTHLMQGCSPTAADGGGSAVGGGSRGNIAGERTSSQSSRSTQDRYSGGSGGGDGGADSGASVDDGCRLSGGGSSRSGRSGKSGKSNGSQDYVEYLQVGPGKGPPVALRIWACSKCLHVNAPTADKCACQPPPSMRTSRPVHVPSANLCTCQHSEPCVGGHRLLRSTSTWHTALPSNII
jgi:hypothetical protein